jgi:hypothetical protein
LATRFTALFLAVCSLVKVVMEYLLDEIGSIFKIEPISNL